MTCDVEELRLLTLLLGATFVVVRDRPRPVALPEADDVRAKMASARTVDGPRLLAVVLLLHLPLPDPDPVPPLLADRRGGLGLGAAVLAKSPFLDATTLSSTLVLNSSSTSPAGSRRFPGCSAGCGGFACTLRVAHCAADFHSSACLSAICAR